MKPTITLEPGVHRNSEIIIVNFPYNRDISEAIKKTKGSLWSQTLRSWYYRKEEFNLRIFFNALIPLAFINYSAINTKSSKQIDKNIKPENVTALNGGQLLALKRMEEHMRLKNLSDNTVKNYLGNLKKFLKYYAQKDPGESCSYRNLHIPW